MLTKRIIPCLDIKDGKVVKGTNFKKLQFAGNPVDLAKKYNEQGADELVFFPDNVVIQREAKNLFGGHSRGVLPDPIPNSEVKPSSADGTAWETVWESRTLPGVIYKGRL